MSKTWEVLRSTGPQPFPSPTPHTPPALPPPTCRPPSPKLRFEAYVCTAAEREYALEAWRVLDPDGWMIPCEQRECWWGDGMWGEM